MGTWKFRVKEHTEDVREYKLIRKGSFISKWLVLAGFLLTSLLLTWPFWSNVQFTMLCLLACVMYALLVLANLLGAREEAIMVIREMGVQLSSTNWLGFKKTQFIDKKQIQAVIINEGIQSFQVLYYMAFILKDEPKMLVAFQHVFPRMPVLLPIYRGVRALLYGEPEEEDIDESDDVYKGATQELYGYAAKPKYGGMGVSDPRLFGVLHGYS